MTETKDWPSTKTYDLFKKILKIKNIQNHKTQHLSQLYKCGNIYDKMVKCMIKSIKEVYRYLHNK